MTDPRITAPADANVYPHELQVAETLCAHYDRVIEFLIPIKGYRVKTPDFVMNGLMWEIKSPTSRKLSKMRDNLYSAKHQSPNIVFDATRTPLDDETLEIFLKKMVQTHRTIKRILLIKKTGEVLELFK